MFLTVKSILFKFKYLITMCNIFKTLKTNVENLSYLQQTFYPTFHFTLYFKFHSLNNVVYNAQQYCTRLYTSFA